MRRFRSLLGFLILGSLVGVGILAWYTVSPRGGKPLSLQTPAPAPAADLKLDRLRYTETREGVKEWELEAASAQYFKEEGTVVFEKVKATFFGRNQEIYKLEGEKGKLNTQTKAIEAFDGVRLESSDGYRLDTRTLCYQADKRELSTADPVEITGPQGKITGTGLAVDLEHQKMRILNQVTTIFAFQGKPGDQRSK